MSINEQQILKNAEKQSELWKAAINFDGKPNVSAIKKILNKRTYQEKPIKSYVVKSKNEAITLIQDLYKNETPENQKVLKKAYLCIWDYYLMAYYESACSQLPNRDFTEAEFIYQSLLPAFKLGLGYLILLGPVNIGICLPEAHCDDQQRIHRENGPAIVWGDEKQYWWHGIEVPSEWIEDRENVDPRLALNHENIEQRRALCEILGWEHVIKQLNPVSIDKDVDVQIGELLEVDLPDSGVERFLKVECGTERTFVIPVPNEIKTALEANAWTYNFDGQLDITNFKPEIRT